MWRYCEGLLFFCVWTCACAFECVQTSSVYEWVCAQEIITIFNILWHSNFIHVVRATHWKTRHCSIFHRFCFALSLPCSLAPSHIFMSPTFFSRLSLSLSLSLPPLCLLSLSVCLSFALSSCRVHTVQCVLFLNEAFFSCSQPVSFAEARPQLADCGCMVAMLIHRESLELAPEREREKQRERDETEKTYSGTVEVIIATDVLWL